MLSPHLFQTDHHHLVLPQWHKLWIKHHGDQPHIVVLHIDQHSDMASPDIWIDRDQVDNPVYMQRYTEHCINIGNFIQPALQAGIINECIQLRSESTLLGFDISPFKRSDTRIILDIDIDYWAPEMVNDHVEATITKTRQLITHADLVTVATSPGFIDQDLAADFVSRILY